MPTMPPSYGFGESDYVYLSPSLLFPVNLWPSLIPLVIVCGSPAAGKSTYVNARRHEQDIVIDVDLIVRECGGNPRTDDRQIRKLALEERNRRLIDLASCPPDGRRAWFITTAPAAIDRRRWAELLRPEKLVLLLCSEAECLRRIDQDQERLAYHSEQMAAVRRWHRDYTPWASDLVVNTTGLQEGWGGQKV